MNDVPWEDIFKLGASAAASEFCKWVQVGIDVYIPHRKYQVKPHSPPWFSAACAAAIVHRNHFFRLYQQNKSSQSKVKFRQASNRCKRVLEAAKLAYANKTNVLSYASDKAKSFAKNFSKKSNLDDLGISLSVFPSRTNLKLDNISVTPKMVKKVITNLDSSKASGPDCIPVVVLKNCEPEFSYILAELFNICLRESCFSDCWKVSLVSLYLRKLRKGLKLKTTALLVFFLWLVKSLKNFDHLEKFGLFSDFQYDFRYSQSTADLLTVVSDRIAGSFNRCGATRAVAIDISKAFDRVWYAGLLHKLKSYGISGQVFGLISSFLSN